MARVIIDVRNQSEYQTSHSNRCKNIPLSQLEGKIASIAKREDEIWVCCESGARSSQAVKKLRDLGYLKVKDIGTWSKL